MDQLLASVIVPTFNRAHLLRRNLRALLRQVVEPTRYEIIVVDNNSTDATGAVVRRMAEDHSSIRYILEPEQGVAHARNAGLRAARGPIVAYIDDDTFAPPGWLKVMIDSFERVQPAPHVVGGPMFPLLLDRRHAWYTDSYDTFSWGDAPRCLDRRECFFGANVAFKREVLVGAGGFRTGLGMKGEDLAYCEDTEVFERLWEYADGRLHSYYAPDAFVMHSIPESRLRPGYRLRRGFAIGQSEYWRDNLSGKDRSARRLLALYRFFRTFAGTVIFPDRFPNYGNWVINCGVAMAPMLGYLAAASGVRVSIRRPPEAGVVGR